MSAIVPVAGEHAISIYVDESGSLPAGAMVMAGVEIDKAAAEQLLQRFRTVTGLRGELKGSRTAPVERALFFELLERFGGRARICVAVGDLHGPGPHPQDFDVYVALLTQIVEEWLPEVESEDGDCARFVIDAGRYDALVLENVRRDVARLLSACGSATMIDSRRSPGVQIADVVANSFYNLAIGSGRAGHIRQIVEPFLKSGVLRQDRLREMPAAREAHPALRKNAGYRRRS